MRAIAEMNGYELDQRVLEVEALHVASFDDRATCLVWKVREDHGVDEAKTKQKSPRARTGARAAASTAQAQLEPSCTLFVNNLNWNSTVQCTAFLFKARFLTFFFSFFLFSYDSSTGRRFISALLHCRCHPTQRQGSDERYQRSEQRLGACCFQHDRGLRARLESTEQISA